MKKSILAALVLVLGCTLLAAASDSFTTAATPVVVDRSTRSKVLNDYTLLTRDAIEKAWKTPLDLNVRGAVKGRVRIDYTLKRSGELDSVKLVGSSGNPQMDRSLIRAIRSAEPFPPFPDEMKAQSVLIRANFIVADVPTAPVTTVSQPVGTAVAPPSRESNERRKKMKWGLPAGTSRSSLKTTSDETQFPLRTKKYQWGAQ
ncbi:MAG: energy transducer TonB [Deltaproteobacteria bacterium]